MSYFHVKPNTLLAQQAELETAYSNLCQDMSEISSVLRQLNTMSSFEGPIAALRRVQQKGSEQEIKLRQCAKVLDSVSELYMRTEQKNLDGGFPSGGGLHVGFHEGVSSVISPSPSAIPDVWPLNGRSQEMLDGAEDWFGMTVVIP